MVLNLKKRDKLFIGIIALVHVVFFMLACMYKRIYMGDSFEYIYEALNIKKYFFFYCGNPTMPIFPEYMTERLPGYPLFLLAIYMFTINNWIVIVFQNVLSVFNIYYARKVFLQIGYHAKYDWLLLLFVIAYPAQFINANTIAPDILLQTFTLLYLGNFVLLLQKKQLKYSAYMSLALIAGIFVKPVLYPFVIIHILILTATGIYNKVLLQRTIAVAIMPICAVLICNSINYSRTGKFHFSSNQSVNAVYYYYAYFSQKEGIDSATKFLHNERKNIAGHTEFKDRYDLANKRGVELLEQNFFPYMIFHLKNSARIFIEPGKGEMDLFTGKLTYGGLYNKQAQSGFYAMWKNKRWAGLNEYIHNNPSLLFVTLVFIFNCLRLIGMLLFFFDRKISWPIRIFIGILLLYFAIAAGPIANTRYFLPESLIAIGIAAMGYMSRLQKRATK